MIWVIGALALVLFGTVLMCILIVGGRADDVMESRTLTTSARGQETKTFPPLHSPAIPGRVQGWTMVQPQQTPL